MFLLPRTLTSSSLALVLLAPVPFAQVPYPEMFASDSGAGDFMGESAALSGQRALLGAANNDLTAVNAGAAYLFEFNGSGWSQTQRLEPLDASAADFFGEAVALSGQRALIGSNFDDDLGPTSGSAYVFESTGGDFVQVAKLLAADGSAGDSFGFSVALDGDCAIVGAWLEDDPFFDAGAAYVFENSGGSWSQVAKLTGNESVEDDRFGYTVAIDGDYAVVGTVFASPLGSMSGAAYVFERAGSTWTQTARLLPSDGASNHSFGSALAIQGDRVLVGASLASGVTSFSGAVYVFERGPGGGWTEVDKMIASNGSVSASFGWSVALDGDRALIGARNADPGGVDSAGTAYLFEIDAAGDWTEVKSWNSTGPGSGDSFGSAVGLNSQFALVTSRLDDGAANDGGSGQVFTLPEFQAQPAEISAALGGMQTIAIDRPVEDADKLYLILGSTSGTTPVQIVDGLSLPLVLDSYLLFTLLHPNTSFLSNNWNTLDANGDAAATFQLPAASNPLLTGLTFHHAGLVLDSTPFVHVSAVTEPVALLIVP